ncbi:MAG: 4-alpha-glucanotransferase [Reyranellaceae bacterium]
MSDASIRDLARRAGVSVAWTDAGGRRRHVGLGTLRHLLNALDLPCATPEQRADSFERLNRRRAAPRLLTTTAGMRLSLPYLFHDTTTELIYEDGTRESLRCEAGRLPAIDRPGYHRMILNDREQPIAVTPRRCLTIGDLVPDRRAWGVAVQLYGLRRDGDDGIGDTTALAQLAASAAAHGADAVALSPTHSLFPEDLSRFGPYSPSSRLFLNPLLADPAALLGADRVAKTTAEAVAEAADSLIDWPTTGAAKYGLLRRLFEAFAQSDLSEGSALALAFQRFVQRGGRSLAHHAEFEAARSPQASPPQFHQFLQWISDGAFAAAQAACRDAGMRIGLIADLAVGLDPAGSEVASRPQDHLVGVRIGAPPDQFNPHGQDWALTTFSPAALVTRGFAPFLATLRAALRHAGGVRIDHVMGLMRLWLVPDGASPTEGAYLSYPLDDLLRLVALESHRHRAIVIGEDLGTVPSGFRRRCREAGIAGMDVLWFQRDGRRFLAPREWRANAVAMTTTHDLPTVAGWWNGADLALRCGLGTLGDSEAGARNADRAALWQAFAEADLVDPAPPASSAEPPSAEPVVDAAIGFVAKARDALAVVPIEDMLGLADQPNLPGTIDQHPNWRRRYPGPAGELLSGPAAQRRLAIVAGHRA